MNAKDIADLAKSLVLLVWSGVGIVVIILLFPSIKDLLTREKVDIQFAGFRMTAEKTADILGKQVQDLQVKLINLEATVANASSVPTDKLRRIDINNHKILWVDDHPENNALQIDFLSKNGFQIVSKTSTEEGLIELKSNNFGIVITDMSRDENGKQMPTAGIDFIKKAKLISPQSNFIIFTVSRSAQLYEEEANKLGIYGITNSTVDLYSLIYKLSNQK